MQIHTTTTLYKIMVMEEGVIYIFKTLLLLLYVSCSNMMSVETKIQHTLNFLVKQPMLQKSAPNMRVLSRHSRLYFFTQAGFQVKKNY